MKIAIKLLFPIIIASLILQPQTYACNEDPRVAALLSEMRQNRWVNWIGYLSGEWEVKTDSGEGRIQTRSSFVMFEPDQVPSAFQYIQEELEELGYEAEEDFTVHTYDFPYAERHRERNWKNLILSIPGSDPDLAGERGLLVAQLDSTSGQERTLAPGADDNGSGSAGLLEAAAILRHHQFKRTINLIWFSGEEQSRRGSEHFVEDYQEWLPEIVGVINLDMFAFDWDEDRCFEVHAGTLPGSHRIGRCLMQVIDAYKLNLSFDFIDDDTAYTLSDHYPFWLAEVPGVMVFENGFYQEGKTCGVADRNYAYHSTADTLTYINRETGFSILQASLAALAHMAEPLGACISEPLKIDQQGSSDFMILNWKAVPGAVKYQVWRKNETGWQLSGETNAKRWMIPLAIFNSRQFYRVVAVGESFCQPHPDIFPPQ